MNKDLFFIDIYGTIYLWIFYIVLWGTKTGSAANMKQKTRQSFSVESLAISSRQEPPQRDTESPYLYYLSSKSAEKVDYNYNPVVSYPNQYMNILHHGFTSHVTEPEERAHPFISDLHHSSVQTSTPKILSSVHNGDDSPSTTNSTLATPSTSDDSGTEEKMVIDESVISVHHGNMEKLSPISPASTPAASDVDNDSICSDDIPRARKKARTAFNGQQLKELEKRYKTQKYLTAGDRMNIAKSLKLSEQQVKTWFQNRRMKEKRQQREEEQSRGFSLPTGGVDVAQLAALGICPPPFKITPTSINGQLPAGLPSPIDLRMSVVQNSNPVEGNRSHTYPVGSSYAGFSGTVNILPNRNQLEADLHALRNHYHNNSANFSAKGLAVPTALYPPRHSSAITNFSPSVPYYATNQTR